MLTDLLIHFPELSVCAPQIDRAISMLIDSYSTGGKLLLCGNGGSCCDAEHITGELMKGFCKKRPLPEELQKALWEIDPERGGYMAPRLQSALPAINLATHIGVSTAYVNDVDAQTVYAQQVLGYAKPGDVVMGISTSGRSANVLCAGVMARALGAKTIGLTGEKKSVMDGLFDLVIHAPATETYRVQEYHLPIYHAICLAVENHFFEE